MKILVVGGGSIGKRHLNNLFKLGYENLYCFKRSYDTVFAKEFSCEVLITKSEVESLSPDVIFVCNPTHLHVDWMLIANKLGCHLFMEKPLTHSKQKLEIAKSKWDNKSIFFIGFMLRYHPLVIKINELLGEGVIGDIYSARFEFGSWLPYWHPWEDYKTSYASRKEMGGGVINTITHELDLIQFFFGSPIKIKTIKSNFGILDIGVEEIVESIFVYEDKLISLHLDYLQKDYDRNIKILGSKGKIVWDWHTNKVIVKIHNGESTIYPLDGFDVNDLYINEVKHFFELISTEQTKHPLDLDHAFENTQLMLEMHK